MITVHPERVLFTEAEFRKYNEAGYEQLSQALQSAHQKAQSAASVEEKKVAQIHLDSVEQLWTLSLQLANERFERARDSVCGQLQSAIEDVRSHRAAGRNQKDLISALVSAAAAFHAKHFEQAEKCIEWVRSQLASRNHLRLIPAVRPVVETVRPVAPEPDVVDLLERALEAEKNNRTAQAYRLYLQVLQLQPENPGARQRARTVGRGRGGRS